MDQVILDLGSDANVLPEKNMGVNGETYTTIVFDLAKDGELVENHTHGRLQGVIMNIEEASALADFEVI